MTQRACDGMIANCEGMLSSEQLAWTARPPPNQSSSDVVGKFGQWSVFAIGGLKCTSKEGMRLSLNRTRQGPNAKRTQGRDNGRIGGNPRPQTNRDNRPAARDRGNSRQVMDKYLALAREASSAGDRIAAEGYFQHAEHYFRQMTANGSDPDERENRAQPKPTSFEGQPHPDLG